MRLDMQSAEWTRKRDFVLNHLTSLGYAVPLMWHEGMSAAGFQEIVPDENGKRQINPENNRILTQFVPWLYEGDWEWLIRNAPLVYEDAEDPDEVPIEEPVVEEEL